MITPDYKKRIQAEYESRSGILYLGNCGLKEIPEEVFAMDWLEELEMSERKRDEQGRWVEMMWKKITPII